MLEQFLQWMREEGKDEKTIKAYRSTVGQFLEWLENTADEQEDGIARVKPITIKEYIAYMRLVKNRKQATINKSIASLKTFFAYLADQEVINDNPMTRIKIQKVQASEKVGEKDVAKWLTREEQEKFLSYVDLEKNEFKRLRNLAIIDLMLYAGLRVAEVESLRLDDVAMNGNVTIREGKKGKYATVTLIEKYIKNLRKWLKYRKALDKDIYQESPYLFVSERSGQLGARAIQTMINKYAKLVNMENVTPHRFRHSFCKNLANAGVPIETISKLARHETIEVTKIYIDNSQAEMLSALEKM